MPTSRSSCRVGRSLCRWRRTCANSSEPSLHAQPAPCENSVSLLATHHLLRPTECKCIVWPDTRTEGHHLPPHCEEVENRESGVEIPLDDRMAGAARHQTHARPTSEEARSLQPVTAVGSRLLPADGRTLSDPTRCRNAPPRDSRFPQRRPASPRRRISRTPSRSPARPRTARHGPRHRAIGCPP